MQTRPRNDNRTAGWVALTQAGLFILIVVNLMLIVPQTFTIESWVTVEAIQQNWLVLMVAPTLEAATSITLLLLTMQMHGRLSPIAPRPAQYLLIAGCIGSGLLLAAGGIQMTTIDVGTSAPANDHALVSPVVAAIASISAGLRIVAYFALGWTFLLWGWLSLQTKTLPKPLAGLLIVAGVLGILCYFYYLFLVLLVLLTVVWSFWLAYVWLRGGQTTVTQPA